ncbi:SGNH/GDSL hydrolase family protein [Bacillus cereus]|uniref:SGNH/GDSL hydrolase family protein n=1 Tax=Bacillus cereus TaxID=1396 RepID=UPI00366D0B07
MADAQLVLLTDELPQGVDKINQGLKNANEALKKSGMNFASLYSNGEKVNISYDWANKKITFNVRTDVSVLVISDKFATNLPQGIKDVTAIQSSIAVLYNRVLKEYFTLPLAEIYTYKQDVHDCCLGYVNFGAKYSTILVDGNMTTILPGVTQAILFSSTEKVNIDYDWKAKTITFDVKQQFGVLVQDKNWSANLPIGKKVLTSNEITTTVWWNRVSKGYFTMSLADAYSYQQSDDDCYLGYVHFGNTYSTINTDNSINTNMAEMHPTGHFGGLSLPTVDFNRNIVMIPRNLYIIKSDKNIKYLDVTKEIIIPLINNNGTIPTWQFLWYNSYLDKFFLSEQPYYLNMRNEPNVFYLGYLHSTAKVFIINNKYQTRKANTASIIGDSISTYEGYIPEGNVPNGNYSEARRPPYRCWWYGITHNLFNLVVNESWGGRRVTKTRTDDNASWALHRIASLEKDGIKPDVVFVELGMNDLLGNITIGNYDGVIDPNDDLTFANCYARLIDGIQKAYPNTRIYCLTIPFAKQKTYKDHKRYNDVIRMIAEQYYCTVIDVTNLGINHSNQELYTFDGVHPNEAGMNIIAGRVYNTVRENTLE